MKGIRIHGMNPWDRFRRWCARYVSSTALIKLEARRLVEMRRASSKIFLPRGAKIGNCASEATFFHESAQLRDTAKGAEVWYYFGHEEARECGLSAFKNKVLNRYNPPMSDYRRNWIQIRYAEQLMSDLEPRTMSLR